MSTSALNISASGLAAAQKMAEAINQNIANSNTPGYRRVDIITGEMNFSGPGNVPWSPAGVKATAVTQDQPWLDNRLSLAVSQNTQAKSYGNAISRFADVLNSNKLENSFSEFMASSQEALMNPTNSPVLERFRATMQGMVLDMNQFQDRADQAIKQLEYQQNAARQEIIALNEQPGDHTARKNELYGEISGIQKALDKVISPAITKAKSIIATAVKDINDKYGKDIITIDNQGRVSSQFENGGDFESLSEYGSQQFNSDFGTIKTNIGVALRGASFQQEFTQHELEGAAQAWNEAYGVDLTQEAIKLRETQLYHQANAMAMKTASDMMGTLLNILA